MRDVLPPEAEQQSEVGRRILSSFALSGYQRVWLPLFEYASVLERGHVASGALRFVEPESGEVVALRSDMTPQIARVVATRYSSAPLPVRLCYQGSVLRRRRERARNASQVVQAGVELVGLPSTAGDFEVIRVLCAAVRAAGLESFALDIGHVEIASSLIRLTDPAEHEGLVEALAAKDAVVLARRASRSGLRGRSLDALVALADLNGGGEVWPEAKRRLAETPAAAAAKELETLWLAVERAGLAPQLSLDFGETWRFNYYTGVMFQILAHGPGEPIASGGRYDNLYENFGPSRSAAGFALDIHNACWALTQVSPRGTLDVAEARVVVGGAVPAEVLEALRRANIVCAAAESDLRGYARAWAYPFVLDGTPLTISHVDSAASETLAVTQSAAVAAKVFEFIQKVSG
ncbi:MAG: hypothetical protein RJA70_2738 [Pseudomonadota bacterium]